MLHDFVAVTVYAQCNCMKFGMMMCSVLQRIRQADCDKLANATYRSAHAILTQDTPPHVPWIPSNFGAYRHLWQYAPMPDSCVLFARKFEPGTAERETFFSACNMLGLDSSCIVEAKNTSRYAAALQSAAR